MSFHAFDLKTDKSFKKFNKICMENVETNF